MRPYHGTDPAHVLRRAGEDAERMEARGYAVTYAAWRSDPARSQVTLTVTYQAGPDSGPPVEWEHAPMGAPPRPHEPSEGMGRRVAAFAQVVGLVASLVVLGLVVVLLAMAVGGSFRPIEIDLR